jgi:hypothetical protein
LYYDFELLFGLIIIIVGVTLIILGVRPSPLDNVGDFDIELLAAIIIIVIIAIGFSTKYEYIPSNDIKTVYSNNDLTVYVDRPSTLIVPVRNMFDPVEGKLQLIINSSARVKFISGAKLSAKSDSILSYYGDFVKNGENPFRQEIWDMSVIARHNGEVKNTTNPYAIDIFYVDNNSSQRKFTAEFNWPIKTTDFDMVTYFMLAFAGVLVSKYTTKLIARNEAQKSVDGIKESIAASETPIGQVDIARLRNSIDSDVKNKVEAILIKNAIDEVVATEAHPNNISRINLIKGIQKAQDKAGVSFRKYDYVWIIISGVIAVLIFSSFQKEVTPTNFLITNISLAFGFGFGFDRILQTGSNLAQF